MDDNALDRRGVAQVVVALVVVAVLLVWLMVALEIEPPITGRFVGGLGQSGG